jgi:hypothetical protein
MNKTQNNYKKKLVTSTKGPEAGQVKERDRKHITDKVLYLFQYHKKIRPSFSIYYSLV